MGKIAKVQEVAIEKIKPYENNAKIHGAEQVEKLKASIEEFGFLTPCLIDKNYNLIAGHGRVMAAKEIGMEKVPCVFIEGLTEAQRKAYTLADNRLGELGEWNMDMVMSELEELQEMDFDIELTGFEIQVETEEPEIEEDSPPEEVETRCKVGDLWEMGGHRLICGDSTDTSVIDRLMDGAKADMVFTDPPYGMKKESEGVLNDNLNYDDLLDFNRQWIPLTFGALKENGSWYCWGIDEPLMDIYSNILKPMQKENKITFRNLITWKKENDNPTMLFNGACSSNNRSYYTNEKCLFVMCGVQGFNNNKEHYNDKYEGIRSYLEGEAKKVGLTSKKLTELTGVQMYGHWFTKSQFTIIPREHYLKLQSYYGGKAFCKPYDELKTLLLDESEEFKTLKEAVMASRAYFDGTAAQCIDVWVHDVTSQKERANTGEHATPKPIELCGRAIKSSSREGELVLDVFGGSGSTLIACEQLNRKCYLCELDEYYCDVIIQRWENLTGKKAQLVEKP
jgi:DNA modification methylase